MGKHRTVPVYKNARFSQSLADMVNRLVKKLGLTGKNQRMTSEQYESLASLKCCIGYNKYGGYCLPEASLHRTAPRKILRGDIYEPATIEFMMNNCAGGDIVHAGTYFGDFLPALSRACAAGARIWAFEPNPENFKCAQITILINALDNVSLRHAGLGEEQSTLKMRTVDEHGQALGGKSRIVSDDEVNARYDEEIQIVTIDAVVDSNRAISIIQLDVEDHEKSALSGALQTIRRCLPILILEIRRDSNLLESEWFAANIASLGYMETETLHGNTVFQCLS